MGSVLSKTHPDYQIRTVNHRCHLTSRHRTRWEIRDQDIYCASVHLYWLHINWQCLFTRPWSYVSLDLMNEQPVTWFLFGRSVEDAEYGTVSFSLIQNVCSRHLAVKSCTSHTRPTYDRRVSARFRRFVYYSTGPRPCTWIAHSFIRYIFICFREGGGQVEWQMDACAKTNCTINWSNPFCAKRSSK